MSQNCKSTYQTGVSRDANNNTLYNGVNNTSSARGYSPPSYTVNRNYQQQVTAKVMFGTVTAMSDLQLQERSEREARRTH